MEKNLLISLLDSFITGKINLFYLLTGEFDNVLLGYFLLWFALYFLSGSLFLERHPQSK